jgi:hypothetical protein
MTDERKDSLGLTDAAAQEVMKIDAEGNAVDIHENMVAAEFGFEPVKNTPGDLACILPPV